MAEIQGGAAATQGVRIRDITGYQWAVLFVAWAGWSLDITDFTLYGLVLRQSLTELLGGNPAMPHLLQVGGLITTIGLLGWAVGGFVFGIIADYLGRVRTLALSILIYSVFTALQGVAQEAWQLGLFRFIAGLGTGAELMIAIPLVAEAFAETHRAKILGFMMTGGGFGNLFAAYLYDWVGPYGWRYVFFAGLIPALLLAFIRRGMVEPERFAAVKARRHDRLYRLRLHRRCDRPPPDHLPLQRGDARHRALSVSRRQHLRPLSGPAADLRLLRDRHLLRPCDLHVRAVSDPCPFDRGGVLQRLRAHLHQLRATGGGPLGRTA